MPANWRVFPKSFLPSLSLALSFVEPLGRSTMFNLLHPPPAPPAFGEGRILPEGNAS